ncbi:MAG: sulfatase-like hydrolase/transferase [Ferruginibacter sp.]|nr:sulfatase-like hydrolase/transferase [Ferruginibacter sp.]
MKSRLQFIFGYFFFWIILSFAGRVFFLWITKKAGIGAGFNEWVGVMWHGARMDLSFAAYLTAPVLLMVIAGIWIPLFNHHRVYTVYSTLVLIPVVLIIIADANAFNAWGYRLDASALSYLKNPKEAWASVAHLPVIWLLIGFVVVIVLLSYFLYKFFKGVLPFAPFNRWALTVVMLFLCALIIVPLRGGFQLAPINQSSVYFSSNNYANQSALNPVWNFIHSVRLKNELVSNPYIVMDEDIANKITAELFNRNSQIITDTAIRKNIILVVWESFTAKVLDKVYKGVEITPGFNRLKNEGIYFDNIYATGDRTDKGIVGVLSGYPAQPINSIVKHPDKSRTLPMLTSSFGQKRYFTGFYYGGEPEFANIKSYLLHGALNEIIDINHFDKADRNSKWGAHDGVVMKYLTNRLGTLPHPFFITWLTLSSHEPYEIPERQIILGDDDESKFLNSIHYTDEVINQFVASCRKLSDWNNTLIVIVADHGHRLPPDSVVSKNFKIPLLILGGNVQPKNIDWVGSQTDVAATVLGYLGMSHAEFPYSRNILEPHYRPWAWYSFNNGFGFTTMKGQIVYDNVGRRPIYSTGEVDTQLINEGRALQQVFYEDFLKRGDRGVKD